MNDTIPRSEFQAAIEAGIKRAGDLLNNVQRDALREVGRESDTTGDSFSTGCPWAQAFGRTHAYMSEPARQFTLGYDTSMIARLPREDLASADAFNRKVVD